MRSFPKILIIAFLCIFILQLGCLIFFLALPQAGQAADTGIKFTPQVQGLDYTFNSSDASTRNIANYIVAIYRYAIGIVGILAAVVLMVGGVLWIVAGGNATQIGEAKAYIGAALTGLVLALTSYLILNTVNPALVNLQITQIPGVTKAPEQTGQNISACVWKNVEQIDDGMGGKIALCGTDLIEAADSQCVGTKPSGATCCCSTLIGSCVTTNNCIDNSTRETCTKQGGVFTEAGKCPTGSCLHGTICEDNYTQDKCIKEYNGTFLVGAKCRTGSCTYSGICENNYTSKSCAAKGGAFAEGGKCPLSCCGYNILTTPPHPACVEGISEDDCKKTPNYSNYISANTGSGGMCKTSGLWEECVYK